MMKRLSLFALGFLLLSFSSDKPAYRLYDAEGKSRSYRQMLERAAEADVVLFGELHNNPICHWMELEITRDLFELRGQSLVLGAEMYEADDQVVMNEFLAGKISEKAFKDEAKQWPNFGTDYKPLVDFAKKNKVPFIATNIPRRYASMVFNRGIKSLDSLDARALAWICPLPFPFDSNLSCYQEIAKATGGHGGENLQRSQAIKDATMSHFILQNLKPGQTFLHYNGAYHSKDFESMVWYLRRARPDLDIVTIHSEESDDPDTFDAELRQTADYVLMIPASMSKSY